jgi:DNA-directed RNA polymerase specialized sigma24 family protein
MMPNFPESEWLPLALAAVRLALKRIRPVPGRLDVHDEDTLANEVCRRIISYKIRHHVQFPPQCIWRTAYNVVIDEVRRAAKRRCCSRPLESEDAAEPIDETEPRHDLDREITKERCNSLISRIIVSLAPAERRVLVTCLDGELDLQDSKNIAAKIGRSPNAVAQSVRRIRKATEQFRPEFDALEDR